METKKPQNLKHNTSEKDSLSAACLPLSLSEMEAVVGGKVNSDQLHQNPSPMIVATGTYSLCHIDGTDDGDSHAQ